MRKVFFVYAIRHLSKKTLAPITYFSACTYEHFSDAEAAMSHMCDTLRKSGCVIVKAKVFKKIIEL